jgi:tRNA threonylcarbamoyl adenosine modification protein YeaZ
VHDHNFIAEMTWRCGQNHSVELYPRLDFLLDKAGLDIKSIESVIVAVGPGSFNGLRVGVSAAKGLAFGLGIPYLGMGRWKSCRPHAESGMPSALFKMRKRGDAAAIYQSTARAGPPTRLN